MNWTNLVTNQFYFGTTQPPGADWQQVSTEQFNALRASGWDPTMYVPPYRVSKDTITSRVLEAGKLTELMTLLANLSPEQQFLWSGFSWFWSNNATVRGMATQLGLDPDQILAPDPYL
jgi:hypothetical protein